MNGDEAFHAGEPVAVNVVLVVEESAKGAPDTVLTNNTVFVIGVNGIVDGVKAPEYAEEPFTTRTFET